MPVLEQVKGALKKAEYNCPVPQWEQDGWDCETGDRSLAIVAGGAAGSLGILFAGGGAAQAAVRSHDAHLRLQSFRQCLPRIFHPG